MSKLRSIRRYLAAHERIIRLDGLPERVRSARERKGPVDAPPNIVSVFVAEPDRAAEWHVQMSCMDENSIEHWHLSAMLWPKGRGSTEEDWRVLGRIVARVVHATGYPETRGRVEPLTPVETTDPNRPHHWVWHADGSACATLSPELIEKIHLDTVAKTSN